MKKLEKILRYGAGAAIALLCLAGCGSSTSTALSCSATASLTSGTTLPASSTVTLDNLMVSITGGTGPYTVAVPGLTTASTSAPSFSYSGSFSVATDSTGAITSTIGVTDTSNNGTAACVITTGASNLGSGTTCGSGNVSLCASPSTSVSTGTSVTLTASDTIGVASPTFSFSDNGAYNVSFSASGNTATLYSSVATSVTVTVYEYASGSSSASASAQITISFGGSSGTTGGNLSCTLYHYGNGYYYPYSFVQFEVVTNTGESVNVNQMSITNENTSVSYPFQGNFYWEFFNPGMKYIELWATGASSGAACNGGAPVTDQVYIY